MSDFLLLQEESDWVPVLSKKAKIGQCKLTATPAKLAKLLSRVNTLDSRPHFDSSSRGITGHQLEVVEADIRGSLIREDVTEKVNGDGVGGSEEKDMAVSGPVFGPQDKNRPSVKVHSELSFSGAAIQAPPCKNLILDSPLNGRDRVSCTAEHRSVGVIRSRLNQIYSKMHNRSYRCFEKGHKAEKCTSARVCFNCKCTGHIVRSCP